MISFRNFTKTSFNKGLFKKIAEALVKDKIDISVVIVGEKRIKELNKKYRNKDKATDVLAFYYGSEAENLVKSGEIVICPAKAGDLEKDLARVFIHGILHILGYNHKTEKDFKKMKDLEEKYLSVFFKH